MPRALNIGQMVAVLGPDMEAVPVDATPGLFEKLNRDFEGFRGRRLLMTGDFEAPWASWERHPAGEEIVYLLSGDVDMVLETPEGEEVVRLREPGSYLIVPRRTWHTARPHKRTHMLFITPGEGTEHRPIER